MHRFRACFVGRGGGLFGQFDAVALGLIRAVWCGSWYMANHHVPVLAPFSCWGLTGGTGGGEGSVGFIEIQPKVESRQCSSERVSVFLSVFLSVYVCVQRLAFACDVVYLCV